MLSQNVFGPGHRTWNPQLGFDVFGRLLGCLCLEMVATLTPVTRPNMEADRRGLEAFREAPVHFHDWKVGRDYTPFVCKRRASRAVKPAIQPFSHQVARGSRPCGCK